MAPAALASRVRSMASLVEFDPVLGFQTDFADVINLGYRGIEPLKMAFGRVGNHPGSGGFSGPGRAVKDDRTDFICFDQAAQQLAWPDNVLLANDLINGPGSHAKG